MNIKSIKKFLKPYRILGRWTTVNGAIQHALAVPDEYDEKKVAQLLKILGQEKEEELNCVYCNKDAATWDHLYNNVQKGKFSGYGNRIFNLVPACRSCNEKKGGKHWEHFISKRKNKRTVSAKLKKIEKRNHTKKKSWSSIQKKCPDLAKDYEAITLKIKKDLTKLDKLAEQIREQMS